MFIGAMTGSDEAEAEGIRDKADRRSGSRC